MPSLIHDIINDLASFAIKYESSIFCVNIKRPHKTSFIECIFFSFLLWHFGCTVSELYEKKCFIEDPETNPDVLRGGHRNPYQLENAIKSGGIVFCFNITVQSLPYLAWGSPASTLKRAETGKLQICSYPSEILNLKSSNTTETIDFTPPWC